MTPFAWLTTPITWTLDEHDLPSHHAPVSKADVARLHARKLISPNRAGTIASGAFMWSSLVAEMERDRATREAV